MPGMNGCRWGHHSRLTWQRTRRSASSCVRITMVLSARHSSIRSLCNQATSPPGSEASPSGMNIELVNTGSELMLGRVLNTHQQWLCRRLADLGHVVTRQVAVADDGNQIQQAVREALGRADLVITTGGLGPTSDDLTRELIAELLGKKLVENQAVRTHIENFFAQRNRPRPAKTSVETFVPEGALFFLN